MGLGRIRLLGLSLVAGCLEPVAIPWPTIDPDHAVIVATIGPGLGAEMFPTAPEAELPARLPWPGAGDVDVVVVEFRASYADVLATPPLLLAPPAHERSEHSQVASFTYFESPRSVWRLLGADLTAGFVADPLARLPVALGQLWIRDGRSCPSLRDEPIELPAPATLLVRLGGDRAALFLADGRYGRFEAGRVTWTEPIEALTSTLTAGWADSRGRMVLGDAQGALWSLDPEADPGRYRLLQAPVFGDDCVAHSIDGAPDGAEAFAIDRCGHLSRVTADGSVVVGQVGPPGERPFLHRLGWVAPGEVLIAWRFSGPGSGVSRFCAAGPEPRLREERFGADESHRPNALAQLRGRWWIAGEATGGFVIERGLYSFDPAQDAWLPIHRLQEPSGTFQFVTAPTWGGFATGVQVGRIALQPDFLAFSACPSTMYQDAPIEWLIALDNGQLLGAYLRQSALHVYSSQDPLPIVEPFEAEAGRCPR